MQLCEGIPCEEKKKRERERKKTHTSRFSKTVNSRVLQIISGAVSNPSVDPWAAGKRSVYFQVRYTNTGDGFS